MSLTRLTGAIFFIVGILVLAGCQFSGTEMGNGDPPSNQGDTEKNQSGKTSITDIPLPTPKSEENVKSFTITADEKEWDLGSGETVDAWAYNGTVPGEAIRVQEGDFVEVTLKNKMDEPVTIHWHGVMLTNQMDGVPGVTQNAVQPGDSFTYKFIADRAGTYWYHSHQHSSIQVDRGLYGPFIVEPDKKTYDRDYVLMLDEWPSDDGGSGMMNNMMRDNMEADGMMGGNGNSEDSGGGMMGGNESNDGMMGFSGPGEGDMDTRMMYDTYTINGKVGSALEPFKTVEGETVRFRLVNAGYARHTLTFGDQAYRVVGNDANPVTGGQLTTKPLEIAPGERIDVELTVQNPDGFSINEVDNQQMTASVEVKPSEGVSDQNSRNPSTGSNPIDYASYGQMKPLFDSVPEPDVEYDMSLGAGMSMGDGMNFTINGETFPGTDAIDITKGDIVKVNLTNDSMFDHPMHLHGHHFQVISRNGEPLKTPLVKDLINVKPGESYQIVFKADNPGHWLFHCHDLNHAAGGMVTIFKYENYYSPFEIGGKYDNVPE